MLPSENSKLKCCFICQHRNCQVEALLNSWGTKRGSGIALIKELNENWSTLSDLNIKSCAIAQALIMILQMHHTFWKVLLYPRTRSSGKYWFHKKSNTLSLNRQIKNILSDCHLVICVMAWLVMKIPTIQLFLSSCPTSEGWLI